MKGSNKDKEQSDKHVLRPRKAVTTCTPQNLAEVSTGKLPENQPKSSSPTKPRIQKALGDHNANEWLKPGPKMAPTGLAVNPCGLTSCNLVYRLQHASLSTSQVKPLKQAVVRPFIQQLSNFRIQSTASPFDRRVTALEWHPTIQKTLAVASKSGDLVLWNYENAAKFDYSKGIGKGGSVTAMTFDLDDPSGVYTSSIDGTVCRQCINGRQNSHHVFLNTADYTHWYCCVGVNYVRKLLLAGDNRGNLTMMEKDGGKILWTRRLHKSKATHCEFNSQCDWLVATASVDKIVKLWDLRMMSDRKSALFQLPHERPINSAYFSPDCTRLLTTDQYGELRIYTAPLWDRMERSISHPHRFFQHITPIKATWHPIHDLVVVGRYPDENFPGYHEGESRTIDVFDANSGDLVHQLQDLSVSGIVSLNRFNPTGDILASGMGYNILIWTDAQKRELSHMEKLKKMDQQNGDDPRGPSSSIPDPSSLQRRRRRRRRDDDDDIGAIKQQLKGKIAKR